MRNKPKVVIDTNIFLHSWFNDVESCDKILDLLVKNKLRVHFSQDMVGELIYMTKKYAIKNMSSYISRLALLNKVSELFLNSISIDTRDTDISNIIGIKDIYDIMFVKCAVESEVDYLITNDFKSGLHSVEGLNFKVLKSSDFMKAYLGENLGNTGTE